MFELKLPPETEEYLISWGRVEHVRVEATPRDERLFNFEGLCRVCAGQEAPRDERLFVSEGMSTKWRCKK